MSTQDTQRQGAQEDEAAKVAAAVGRRAHMEAEVEADVAIDPVFGGLAAMLSDFEHGSGNEERVTGQPREQRS